MWLCASCQYRVRSPDFWSLQNAAAINVVEQELARAKEQIKNMETEHGNKVQQMEKEHKTAIDQLSQRAEKAETDLATKEREFRTATTEILNRFMRTDFWKVRMAREYASGHMAYRREAINAGVDVSPVEGEDFDPEEPDPVLPADEFDLNLELLEQETREADERRAREDQEAENDNNND